MNITDISTQALIDELLKREGINKIAVGSYKTHDIVSKYGCPDTESDFVITVTPNVFANKTTSAVTETVSEWRRFELITDNCSQIAELNNVLDKSKLSRRELAVIVSSLRVRPEFCLKDFDT